MSKKLRITLVKSPIGSIPKHQATLKGLGLRKIRQTVELLNTPEIRGMANKVCHLINVEEV